MSARNEALRQPDVYTLSNEFVERFADLSPVRASYWGVAGRETRWDDFGPAGAAARTALVTEFRTRLDALTPATDRYASVAARVMRQYLAEEISYFEHGEQYYDLNNIDSSFQTLRQVFDVMDSTTARGFEAIATRLETIDIAARGYRATLEAGLSRGRVVAQRQVRAVIAQGRVSAGEGSFFLTLLTSFDRANIAEPALRARLEKGVAHARATFAELAAWLEDTYLPRATPQDAVGRERYLRAAERFLGMTIDPLETYAWGWSQVREIEREMARVAAEIKPGATVAAVIELLKTDPARLSPTLDDFIALMKARQARALAELSGTHFDIPDPIRTIDVRVAPPGGPLGAYYMPPSEDFARAGTVWYAPAEKAAIPVFDEITTAYHEGFPGHHLQCSLQVYLADKLSRLQRLAVFYPGYAEGWALYAEHLMNELGYFERPDFVLGMHVGKLVRACRVVVDIGLHLGLAIPDDAGFRPGEVWDFDRAVEFMVTRAFMPDEYARSEVTRYLGWPGQAISYKVGERVILELRDAARAKQGAAFDLKAFHGRVLETGAVGLDLLRELVLEG